MYDARELFDVHIYTVAVGCLIYLEGNTQPDIQCGVSQTSKFMHSPRIKHWQVVKCILRYLSSTLDYAMFFPRGDSYGKNTHMQLLGYSNSNQAGDYETQQFTRGGILGSACISCLSNKQPTMATLTCEAEYRVAFTAIIDCVWLRRLLANLHECQQTPTTILIDSQSAMVVAINPVFHARTKHIGVHYHYVRETLHARDITLIYCATQDNIANIFTKTLPREKFEAFKKSLGLLPYRA